MNEELFDTTCMSPALVNIIIIEWSNSASFRLSTHFTLFLFKTFSPTKLIGKSSLSRLSICDLLIPSLIEHICYEHIHNHHKKGTYINELTLRSMSRHSYPNGQSIVYSNSQPISLSLAFNSLYYGIITYMLATNIFDDVLSI